MAFDASTVLLAASCYLLLFFGMALLTEKGMLPERMLHHPCFYVLSLGIIVSSWSFYTVYLSASARGFGYNAYYIGFAGAFILSPLMLQPLLRITHLYQLSSLADLFAFRFRSAWSGTFTTLILLLCAFPLIALQTLLIASSATLLAPSLNQHWVALAFNVILLVFALRFGIADVAGREPNKSLVASLAFEGLFKLLVLAITAIFAIYGVFQGVDSLQSWLQTQPPAINRLHFSFLQDSTNLLILLFFTASIAMPHIFHMIFPENRNPHNLRTASWAVPLYLLLASLPVLPVLWAYNYYGLKGDLQFAPVLLTLMSRFPLLSLLYFLGGLAASTGLTVVLALSVANMCINHILLRASRPPAGGGLYSWLILQRRAFIVGIFFFGYLYYLAMSDGRLVQDTGFISFIACLQFLPGIVTLLYWPGANSKGFISGLAGGSLVWLVMGLSPYLHLLLMDSLPGKAASINWNLVAGASLLTNLGLLLVVSVFTGTDAEERKAALLCASDAGPAERHVMRARSVVDFISSLSGPMGADAAGREVAQALRDLRLHSDEKRPFQLLQMRTQLEANLSSLLGPTLAHDLMENCLPLTPAASASSAGVLNILEQEAESRQGNLTGVALDLDLLRRHHRQILLSLPMGVCELDDKNRIALWNTAMYKLTGLSGDIIASQPLSALPEPWQSLLQTFAYDHHATRIIRQPVQLAGKTRWLSLHKSVLSAGTSSTRTTKPPGLTGQIILVEDQTETTLMEKELAHADRLNSIGRLAAGVAHEIGNPVTGIACLAQNIRDEYTDPGLQGMTEKIMLQTKRISSITDALLRFSHHGAIKEKPAILEAVDLGKVVVEAISLFALQQDGTSVTILNECRAGTWIRADYQQLLQIMLNLLGNARDASQHGDCITVSGIATETECGLVITDQGCGIPMSLLPRIFEPFFTTKDPGKGTGLGLALVYRLVTDLGGVIRIESHTGEDTPAMEKKGTQVFVTFPCYDPGTLVTEATVTT